MSPAAVARLSEAMPAGFRAPQHLRDTEWAGLSCRDLPVTRPTRGPFTVWADHHLIEIVDRRPASRSPSRAFAVSLSSTSLQREGSYAAVAHQGLTMWAAGRFRLSLRTARSSQISWISGRTDDVLKVRGTLVMPSRWRRGAVHGRHRRRLAARPRRTRTGSARPRPPSTWRSREEPRAGDRRARQAACENRLGIQLPVLGVGEHELPR